MKLRKATRILLWSVGALAAATVALYLLRWPLLEGTVRSRAALLVADHLQADLEIGRIGGSLLYGLHAEDVTLKPRPGASFRSAHVDSLSVEYGLLGSGEPSLRAEGARIVLSRQDGPAAPIHESIRDVVSLLRSLRFAGSVEARKVDVVLPDGRTLALDRGALDHATWSVSLRADGFGRIDGTATLSPDGALSFRGKAVEGPLRSATLDLGPGADQSPLKISAELEGRKLDWAGTAFFTQNRLARVDGDLRVKEGRARTNVDFLTGRVEADVDALLAVDEELKGDVAVKGRAEGPLAGPKENWTVRGASLTVKGARLRQFAIDEAEVALGTGTLSKIDFKGRARSGKDVVSADGVFRWTGKPEVEATVDVTAAAAAPYLTLLAKPPPLKCADLHAAGTLIIREGAASYDGLITTGAGTFERQTWTGASFQGLIREDRLEAREFTVSGSPFAATVTGSGKLEGETLALRLAAGKDEVEIGGRLAKDGDFEGRIRLEGPCAWLKGFDVALPESLSPVRAAGKMWREKGDTRVLLDLTAGKETSASPAVTIRADGNTWLIAVAPGTVEVPGRRVDYDAFVLSFAAGKASVESLTLKCSEPQASARISGSADWDAKETRVSFRMLDTVITGTPIDPLFARVRIDVATGEVFPDLRWGREEGDHLRVTGRWGRELDLRATLEAKDLKRPLIRRFLAAVELEGAVALEAHVTGTPAEPVATGTLRLSKVTTFGLPPLSLVIPLKSEQGMLRIWSVAAGTPYGALTIEGSVPLPGSKAPVDLTLRIQTADLSPLLDRMTRQARVWIPAGRLNATVSLQGPMSKTELTGRLEFTAASFKPPAPLPGASDLRILAHLDEGGVVIETADGLLEEGPFWASGRWDVFRPGRALSLWITGWDVLVVDDPLVRIRVKPDAMLTWSEGRSVRLAGRVEIPLAIWHREFSAATPGNRSAARPLAAPRLRLIPGDSGGFIIPGIEGLEGLELDLQVATTGEFRIENSVAGVILIAEGLITGTGAEPTLSAVIRSRARRGEIKIAPGTYIRIESAEAVLPEEVGRPPMIRFNGRVGAGEAAIQIVLDGPLESPGLVLKSEPPQSQKDLLARLAFGLGTGAVSGETGVATLAIYLYEQVQNDWPSADRKEGFFDKFRPSVIPGDSSQTRRAPWELPPAGTLRSTSLRTEYVYNRFFSIVAETNREGDVGGDLKLRIRF